MFSRKVLEGVYRANIARGKVPFAVLPIMAIGGAAAAADNRLTPQQEKILHEGSAPDKGQYTATAKTDYENHPPRVGREPTQKEIAEGRTDKFRVTPTLTGTSNTTSYNQYNPTVPGSSDSTSMSKTGYTGSSSYTGSDYSTGSHEKAHHTGMARIFDKDFWNRPLDESSRVLGTYVRQASIDLQRSPLRPEHQFSALAGENLEDRGPEDSLMKRVTNKVGEYLPHTQDTKRDYSYQRDTYEYPKGTIVSEKATEMKDKSKEKLGEIKEKAYETKDKTMEKMGEMKEKAADKAYQTKEQTKEKMEEMKDKASDKAYDLKEKTMEVASDLKEKVSEYTPSTHDMKEKLHETKEKAEQMADSLKNKVAEYIPSSISNLTESVKSVVVGSESNESKVPGDAERMKTRMGEEAANLLQSHSPINAFKTHTSTIRLYADEPKRQLMTHKYTAHVNEDVMQTLIMDSDRADARLIGIEYCISDKVYKQLPEDEKKFWYSHAFETKSGIEVAPRLPSNIETKLMSDLAPTWGKAVSLWHVDKNLLPVGFPKLMAPPANEQMINRSVWEQREKLFGPVADERKLRQPIQVVMPNRDEWDKKGAVFTPEYKKL